jgi:protein TonB
MKKIIILFLFILSSVGIYSHENLETSISEQIANHDLSDFYNEAAASNLEPGRTYKVYVQFGINRQGEIMNVAARGQHELLEKEAIRIVKGLKNIKVPKNFPEDQEEIRFTLPINMYVETEKERAKRLKKEERKAKFN